jgi:predicted nucleic acid-binding Zn ribbon protein
MADQLGAVLDKLNGMKEGFDPKMLEQLEELERIRQRLPRVLDNGELIRPPPPPRPAPPRPAQSRVKENRLPAQPEKKKCRICFEDEASSRFIAPCLCKGSQKWVHLNCLNQWRRTSANKTASSKCGTCNYDYKFERTFMVEVLDSSALMLIMVVLIVVASIILCSALWYFPRRNSTGAMLVLPHIPSSHTIITT